MISLLSLFDDIAATMDDVAIMTKVAIKKTSALMSDDLAVNAGVVHGVSASRELPVVKSIFIGSLYNKVYSISVVFLLLFTYPPLLNWLLLIGGIYLSYEGVHKIWDKISSRKNPEKKVQYTEQQRIKGAVRTDLILSLEIIVIAQSSITSGTLLEKLLTLITVGLLASILIYGLVAILVKIDDFGVYLVKKEYKKTGQAFINSMPYIMKGLGFIGTTAMLLVGGGIINHHFHLPYFSFETLQHLVLGLIGGVIILLPYHYFKKLT